MDGKNRLERPFSRKNKKCNWEVTTRRAGACFIPTTFPRLLFHSTSQKLFILPTPSGNESSRFSRIHCNAQCRNEGNFRFRPPLFYRVWIVFATVSTDQSNFPLPRTCPSCSVQLFLWRIHFRLFACNHQIRVSGLTVTWHTFSNPTPAIFLFFWNNRLFACFTIKLDRLFSLSFPPTIETFDCLWQESSQQPCNTGKTVE